MPRRDRILALLCLIAFAVCAALFVGIQVRSALLLAYRGQTAFLEEFFFAFVSGLGAMGAIWLARANDRGRVTTGAVIKCVTVLGSVLASFGIAFVGPHIWLMWQMYRFDVPIDVVDAAAFAPPVLFAALIGLIAWRGWRVVRLRTARAAARSLDDCATTSGPCCAPSPWRGLRC